MNWSYHSQGWFWSSCSLRKEVINADIKRLCLYNCCVCVALMCWRFGRRSTTSCRTSTTFSMMYKFICLNHRNIEIYILETYVFTIFCISLNIFQFPNRYTILPSSIIETSFFIVGRSGRASVTSSSPTVLFLLLIVGLRLGWLAGTNTSPSSSDEIRLWRFTAILNLFFAFCAAWK